MENSTISALVEQVKPPVSGTEASLQPVPLLWSLLGSLSAHSSASCSAQSTQGKVGVMNALSTVVSGLCNPRNNFSLGSFKIKSIEVRFKEKSKLADKLESVLLLRCPISLTEFLPFTARTDECCKQGRFCWQPDSYVQAFMIKP